ncbi:MAG: hypothetical protein DMD35_19245 [Gemmatimonadetes bacterium]|nr:MAG: hypothetical protein DMD35_19245 [Gemmatimonadota bacterium]
MLSLVLGMLSRWAQQSGEAVVQRELEQSADLVAQYLSARQRSLAGGARVFVQDPNFRSFVHEHLRDELLDQALEAEEQLEAKWVFVVDENGVVLAKSDEPGAAGTNMGNVPLIAGALQGSVTTGFGVSGDTLLFQAVAVPIVVPGQAPIGALVATKAVDPALARDVKAASSAEIVFYVRDGNVSRVAATSFDRAARTPLGADVASQPRGHATVNGVRYATQGAALTTAGGDIVGGYVVMSARDAASADIAAVRRALLLAGLLGLAMLSLAAIVLDRGVSRPLRALALVARRAELGEAENDPPTARASSDEVAVLTDAVQSLADDLVDRAVLSAAVSAVLPSLARAQGVSAGVVAPVLSMVRVQGAPARVSAPVPRAPTGTSSDAPSGEPAPGDVIVGRYRIDAVLASGELGVTYRARDRVTSSVVALKRYRAARIVGDAVAFVESLREEIRTRRLIHRNIVRLRDAGDDAGVPFVTMDYVEGLGLESVLRSGGPLAEEAVVAIARQICRALAAAHASGAVHGSLAPRHILIGFDGVLRVGDFTIARVERRLRGGRGTAPEAARASTSSEIPQLAGATVGAPEYMSPEQLIGERPTPQTDLYAAGVVLYECVTGATPFRTDSPLAFLAQKLGDADSLVSTSELRASRPLRGATAHVLNDVIARMLAPDTAKRAASASALLELLERAG